MFKRILRVYFETRQNIAILFVEILILEILIESHMTVQTCDTWTFKQLSDRNLMIHNYPSPVQLLLRIQTLKWLLKMFDMTFILCFLVFWMLVMMVLCLLYIIDQIHELRRDVFVNTMMNNQNIWLVNPFDIENNPCDIENIFCSCVCPTLKD